jgi:hypothetical protein
MRDTDVAPKCAAFREARRDQALAAADYFKIAGRNFEVELESEPEKEEILSAIQLR